MYLTPWFALGRGGTQWPQEDGLLRDEASLQLLDPPLNRGHDPTSTVDSLSKGSKLKVADQRAGLPSANRGRSQFADGGLRLRTRHLAHLDILGHIKGPVHLCHDLFVRLVDVNGDANLGP